MFGVAVPLPVPDSVWRALLLILALLLNGCDDSPQLPSLSPGATILAFGDSLTAGKGAAASRSYPVVLSELTGLKVVNAGISGELSSNGLIRLPALLDQHQPELLIICHGGNDLLQKRSTEQLIDNLRQMAEAARRRGVAVLLISVPRPKLILSSNPDYQALAEELELPWLDGILEQILANPGLKSDSVHPNAAGYRLLAERIAGRLQELQAL